MLDRLGSALEQRLDAAEQSLGATPVGAVFLGVGLAAGAIVGGIGTFLLVLVVLVTLLH